MSSERPDAPLRLQRIEALFHELLDLPPGTREARLAEEAALEPEVATRVRALLAAAGEAEGFFAELPGRVEASRETETLSDLRGRRAGAYIIDVPIGRGGMGAVYRAHRADEQFEKSVAIKLVPMGLLTASAQERFRRERQLLARLEHPNIARLIDGGVLEDGTPYLVMELVEGQSIDRWCDARNLGVRERVELLLPVLDAVQYAHQSLVLHSDIKPDNVLVTERGEVKLLDFGIARTLDEAASEGTLTRSGSPLTPAFASPEQLRGEPLTTASDVYSMGAMAYAMITGTRPYELTGRSTAEIARVVSEQPPRRPSVAVRTAGEAAAEWSALRGVTPAALTQALEGDLDTVILTAIHPDPARRYASVAALADDLRAYLAGRAVAARRDNTAYVLSRYLRRHRAAVLLGAALVLALLAGAAAWTIETQRHSRQLSAALARAEREAKLANTTASYLESMFESADPDQNGGRARTLDEVLQLSEQRMPKDLATQPSLLAHMLNLLARLRAKSGKPEAALALMDRAIAARRADPAPDSLELAADLEGRLLLMQALGDFGPATDSVLAVARGLRARNAADSSGRAPGWMAEGVLAANRQEWEPADSLLLLTYRGLMRGHPIDSARVARVLGLRGEVRAQLGLGAEAESLHREGVRWAALVFGPTHSTVGRALERLGEAQLEAQRLEASVGTLTEARAKLVAVLGEDDMDVSRADDYLGRAYMLLGRYDESRASLERVLAARERVWGAGHPFALGVHNSLGVMFRDAENYPEAIRHLRIAVEGLERARSGDEANLARIVINLANALIADGQLDAGERWLERAEAILRRQPHPEARQAVLLDFARARIADSRGQWASAERGYQRVLPAQRAFYSSDHTMVGLAEFHYGRFLANRGRAAEAESLLTSALRTFETRKGPEHLSTARVRVVLAGVWADLGRPKEAAASLARGLATYRRHLPESHTLVREAFAVEARTRAAASAVPSNR